LAAVQYGHTAVEYISIFGIAPLRTMALGHVGPASAPRKAAG